MGADHDPLSEPSVFTIEGLEKAPKSALVEIRNAIGEEDESM